MAEPQVSANIIVKEIWYQLNQLDNIQFAIHCPSNQGHS